MGPPALPTRMQQGATSLHELSPYDAGAESQISSISFQPQKELAESAGRLYHPPKIPPKIIYPLIPSRTARGRAGETPRWANRGSLPSAASHRAQLRSSCPAAGWPGGNTQSKEPRQPGPGRGCDARGRGARRAVPAEPRSSEP